LSRAASFPVQQRIIGPGAGAPLRSVGSFQVRHNIEGPPLSTRGPPLSTRGGPLYSALPLASEQPRIGPSALDTNNWGGTRGLFFEPDFRLSDEDQWQYVGRGRGGYTKVPEYRFAGLGQGDYVKGGGTVYSWRLRTRCLLCLALLLLVAVGLFLWLLFDPNDPLHVAVPMEHRRVHSRFHPDADGRQQGHNTTLEPLGTGCRTLCEYDGISAPCKSRVRWAADHIFSSEPRPAACSKGYDVVMVQCPVCAERSSGCRRESMGCAAKEGPPPRPVVGDGCDKRCELGGIDGTCASHAARLAGSRFAAQRHGCALGLGLVLYGCPACEMCTLAASGCEEDGEAPALTADHGDADPPGVDEDAEGETDEATPGLPDAVGHHAGRAKDAVGHAASKAKDSLGHVAGKAAEATSHWHDAASPHLENAKDSIGDAVGHVGGLLGGLGSVFHWGGSAADEAISSMGQRRRRRSPAAAEEGEEDRPGADAGEGKEKDLFDCSANFEDGSWRHNWSAGHKLWCCGAYARGCDGEDGAIDCGAGEPKGWTSQKRTWCCEKESKGCPSKG